MTDAASLLADPAWLPHRYDPAGRRVLFARISREDKRALTFLADHQPREGHAAWLSAAEVSRAAPPAAPLHFIFHTAFCRSTLLTRALDLPGAAMGLSEPAILNDLTMAGDEARALLAPVLALLARPQGAGEAVVVKPSNVANPLIAAMMQVRPDARAVLMSGSLEAFLRSVHKKGMMGRRWARRLHLHLARHHRFDFGMSQADLFGASDMQIAGLAWFVQQHHFAELLAGPPGARMRTLDADDLIADKAATLRAVADHFGLDLEEDALRAVADGPLFARHAKLGTDYAETISEQDAAAQSPVVEEEIAMVARWVGEIVRQTGLALPARKPLGG